MGARRIALFAALALCGCKREEGPRSLVGDFAAPGTYALAADTMTVWKRVEQPNGLWLFESWSIAPGGTVEYLMEQERGGAPVDPENVEILHENRRSFALPPAEFQAIRRQAALLRPATLGSRERIRGYGGEARAKGCPADAKAPRIAGINFLNDANWGAFVLQADCATEGARAAQAAMTQLFDRLERAAPMMPQPRT